MSFTLDVNVKNLFFDKLVVRRMMNDVERRGLSRIGGYLRLAARGKLRRRKRVSRPGESPSVHSSSPSASLKNILFAYEPSRHGVVVGPVRLNQFNHDWIAGAGSIPIPQLMEEGGVLTINEISTDNGKHWRRRNQRRRARPGDKFRKRRAVYKPRPFMAPAMKRAIERGKIPSIFTARAA